MATDEGVAVAVVAAGAEGGSGDEDGDAAPSLPPLLLLVAPSVDDAAAPGVVPSLGAAGEAARRPGDGPARRGDVLTDPPGDALDLLEGQGLAVAGGRGDSGGLLVLVHGGAGIGTVRLT